TGRAEDSRFRRWCARLGTLGVGLLAAALVAAIIAPALPDHTNMRVEDGQVRSQYSNPNRHHEVGMLASGVLALVTMTLAWGRAMWWRRARLVGVAALAAIALVAAVSAVSNEHASTFRQENTYGLTKGGKDEIVKQTTSVSTRVVDAWVYVK